MLTQDRIDYLRQLRPHLIATILLLAGAILAGLLSGIYAFGITSRFGEPVDGMSPIFLGVPKSTLALVVFANNSLKTLIVMNLGILCGVLPVLFILVNGYAIGFVLTHSLHSNGVIASLLAIVPHGMFELPGVLLGASIGLMLGARATKRLFGKSESTASHDIGKALRFFWGVITPLLLLGAFVEAFVTPALLSL